jgi:uncharacterized BrkB/YihY/UPF0761 family membrane protein
MREQHQAADARPRPEDRRGRLKHSRQASLLVAAVQRFAEIDGATQGGLLSIQLFTTVIPLIVIGFAHFSGFARNASVGDLFIRDFGLNHALADRVREAFGSAVGVRSVWTFVGVAGFLVWGIPMSARVAEMFARAWRRPQLGTAERLARGAAWFTLFLASMDLHERLAFGGQHGTGVRAALLAVSLVPLWTFWSLTPVLLLRDGGRSWRHLLLAGLAGVLVDGVVFGAVGRLGFPMMLEGWAGFGPMGVAMALMTWCGIVALGWVVIACLGAVMAERRALPTQAVHADPG